MSEPEIQSRVKPQLDPQVEGAKKDLPSLLQLIFSSLALLILLGIFGLSIITMLFNIIGGASRSEMVTASTQNAVYLVLIFLLSISVFLSVKKLRGYSFSQYSWLKKMRPFFHPKFWILSYPFWLVLGQWAQSKPFFSWTLFPVAFVFTAFLPLIFVLWLAIRGLPQGSHQRIWGSLTTGSVLAPIPIIIFEILALILIGILAVFIILLSPEFADQSYNLVDQLDSFRPDNLLQNQILMDLIQSPITLIVFLIYMAVIVPLIEELLKPLAVWLLLGKVLSPTDGFVIGAISGMGFALFENFSNRLIGPQWAWTSLARAGVSSMHILTAGLMGWALVSAWKQKRYLRLLLIYLLSVILHGIWNGVVVLSAFAAMQSNNPIVPYYWVPNSVIILLVFSVGLFVTTILINRSLRKNMEFKQDTASQKNSLLKEQNN